MAFVKKEQNELQSIDIKNERANICALFGKSHDQNKVIMFENIINEGNQNQSFDFDIFWEAQSKILFIGEGDLPFNKTCLIKFANSNDLSKFLESSLFNTIKEEFNNNKDELEVLVLKEQPLPNVLKILMVLFRALGKIIPFSKFKGQEKSDFENLGGINPRLDQIDCLKDSKLEGPFHMINFLSFKGKQGFYDYQKYGFVALRGVLFLGGRPAFIGRVISKTKDNWSQLAIMEYPTIESFMNLAHMPGYAKATFLRAKGLLKTLLVISKPSKKP